MSAAGSNPAPSAEARVEIYRLAPSLRARLLGALLAVLGVLLCVATAVVLLLRLPLDALSAVVVAVVVVVLVGGYLLNRRTVVLHVDQVGYRVRLVRGVGVAAARWVDVASLETAEVAGSRCVVLRLRDGRSTTVPVDVLGTDPEALVRALRARLRGTRGASGAR